MINYQTVELMWKNRLKHFLKPDISPNSQPLKYYF